MLRFLYTVALALLCGFAFVFGAGAALAQTTPDPQPCDPTGAQPALVRPDRGGFIGLCTSAVTEDTGPLLRCSVAVGERTIFSVTDPQAASLYRVPVPTDVEPHSVVTASCESAGGVSEVTSSELRRFQVPEAPRLN